MFDSNALNLNYDHIIKNHFAHIYLLKEHVQVICMKLDAAFFGVLDQAYSDSKATVE